MPTRIARCRADQRGETLINLINSCNTLLYPARSYPECATYHHIFTPRTLLLQESGHRVARVQLYGESHRNNH